MRYTYTFVPVWWLLWAGGSFVKVGTIVVMVNVAGNFQNTSVAHLYSVHCGQVAAIDK